MRISKINQQIIQKMSLRLPRRNFTVGFLSLFLLAMAVVSFLLVPSVRSAGVSSSSEVILQTATDNVLRLSITTNDIIYNPQDKTIYASRPSSVGESGNSITRINPLTGEVGASVYVGSEPNELAISDDGQVMYVALDGAYAIRRYETSTQTPSVQFPIGRFSDSSSPLGSPYNARDLAVAPGNSNLLAVARYSPGLSDGGGVGVAIFNNGTQLPNVTPAHGDTADFLAFSTSATTLYGGGYDTVLRTMTVNESGVTDITETANSIGVREFKFENNLIFTSNGRIITPATPTLLGTCPGINTTAFVPDTASGRVLYAVKEDYSRNITIKACDINTFTTIESSLTIPNTMGDAQPKTLIRYGANGLALRTWDNKIYLIQTALIPTANPLPTPTGAPTITPTPVPTVFAKFVRSVDLRNNDLIYNRTEQKFYASVPSSVGAGRGNTITRIEPTTATIENSVFVGSEPNRLALSDDDKTLYVGLDGANAIRKFDMQTQTPGLQFPLGTGVNGPKTAMDIDVMPGSSNTVAVSYGTRGYNYDGADIYDDGVKRAQKANMSGSVEFASPSLLYVGENLLYKYAVSSNGLSQVSILTTNNYGEAELANGLIYGASGKVVDPATGVFKGTFTELGDPTVLTVDEENNRVFFLTGGNGYGGSGWSIRAYRLDNFLLIGSIQLPEVALENSIRRIYRWGENGLAFTSAYSGKIYFVQTDLVSSKGTVPTALTLSAQAYNRNESSNSLPVTVVRSGGLPGTTTVDYATVNGTATAGSDYTTTAGTLTFAPGESSKIINIPLINDNVFEGDETLNFVLSNPHGEGTVEIQNPNTAVLTIVDNETFPFGSVMSVSVNEPPIAGTKTAIITVQLNNPTTKTVTVNYKTINGTATAGSDYIATSGTLTFAPLETVKTIEVQILADENYNEPNEYFLIDFSNAVNASIYSQPTISIINYNPRTARHIKFDFDGDGKSDVSVFRPENGTWHLQQSQSGYAAPQFGLATDKLVPADYDGDGKTDLAVFRENPADPGKAKFFILHSANNQLREEQFGSSGDIPVSGDWDGDGKADIGVYRQGMESNPQGYFYYRPSSVPTVDFVPYPWGSPGDKPVVADFDGDKKTDPAVFRPATGEWFVQRSRDGFYAIQFGAAEDKPVVGDYDGDGKADQAVFRPSNGVWYIWRSSSNSFSAAQFGIATDKPVPADYDGDGKTDYAVYRDGNWFILNSTAGFSSLGFGNSTDKPVPYSFVP